MKRPITPRGYASLRDELKRLKTSRPELSRAIEAARAHGDISENADYDAAKNKSGLTEAKIRDLETKLANAEIIDPSRIGTPSKVVFGASARISDLDSDEQRTLTILGPDESNVDRGWISCESPLGKSLIGKEVGDVVKANLPGGVREYEILEIFVDYEPIEEQNQGEAQ